MLNWILDVLRGAVMGIANIIPGVSGGTMAVSMGIYDRMIYAVNNIVKKFKLDMQKPSVDEVQQWIDKAQ